GKPDYSLLVQRVQKGEMPPGKKKLSAAQIETLRNWVAAGAPVETAEPKSLASGFAITDADRRYWAFQPITRPPVPDFGPALGVQNPIDQFVLAKLNAKGRSFAAPVDRSTLIRRVTFDLTGLPPTPEEVNTFVRDESTDAYERLVGRLLASPR